ncbi:MAG TPA: hypothetical protein VIG47_10925, partial [Gemmatimonadaceae bacterium]
MPHAQPVTLTRIPNAIVLPPIFAIALLVGCGARDQPRRAGRAERPDSSPPVGLGRIPTHAVTHGVTRVAMRNVDFYVDPNIVLRIRDLHGTMRSKTGGPIVFDDKHSFIIHITSADVGLNGHDLSALMNKYIFAYKGAPITRVSVVMTNGEMRMTGQLHKGINIPFEIHAQVSATPDGMMRIHPTQTKIFRMNGAGLMRLLHLTLQKLIDVSKATGVTVVGDDMFIDPAKVIPPPTIEGRVTRVRVDGDQIVQTFGTDADRAALTALVPPDATARNYMYYRGGSLRFGRLTMADAEMQIVDLDPSDPFEFELDQYNKQLVAGYSKTLPSLGLEVFMRDIDKVGGTS